MWKEIYSPGLLRAKGLSTRKPYNLTPLNVTLNSRRPIGCAEYGCLHSLHSSLNSDYGMMLDCHVNSLPNQLQYQQVSHLTQCEDICKLKHLQIKTYHILCSPITECHLNLKNNTLLSVRLGCDWLVASLKCNSEEKENSIQFCCPAASSNSSQSGWAKHEFQMRVNYNLTCSLWCISAVNVYI